MSDCLNYLAEKEKPSAFDIKPGLPALLFLCREVLCKDLGLPLELVWDRRPNRLLTLLTKEEVRQVLAQLAGLHRLFEVTSVQSPSTGWTYRCGMY
ncbi:MAG: hypothetical protein PVG56_10240, partial [Anaerolineae bacterium]